MPEYGPTRGNCPHCGTKGVAFEIRHWAEYKLDTRTYRDLFAQCGICGRAVIISVETALGNSRVQEILPPPPSTDAPKHTPPNVARFFQQAMDNLPKNYDAAGSMFRKALDVGLKIKFSDVKGTLDVRIKKAAEEHKLTPDMAKWAHQVRLGGNDATHEEEPFSEEAAKELASFTKLVLLYLFTLPGMLKDSRRQAESRKEKASG